MNIGGQLTGYIELGIFFTPSLSPREDVSIETAAGLPRVYSDVTHERVKLGKNKNGLGVPAFTPFPPHTHTHTHAWTRCFRLGFPRLGFSRDSFGHVVGGGVMHFLYTLVLAPTGLRHFRHHLGALKKNSKKKFKKMFGV